MAHFDKSLKIPMGTNMGRDTTANFADRSSQRLTVRTLSRAGPGNYHPHYDDFSRYNGPPASPGVRQPLRQLPRSPQISKGDTRFVSSAPQFENSVTRTGLNTPGPGHYSLERYSQFTPIHITERSQPFAVMNMSRSSIRDAYPDSRCNIPCRLGVTPSPQHYAPVPALDRLRMSMRNPLNTPRSLARIRPSTGTTLDAALRSSANLQSTMRDVQPRGRTAMGLSLQAYDHSTRRSGF